ncbi:hypothetical protein VOLCADRAFT_108019 [Volvox carteri f. nagariensis]|uniref:Uncharacterized protein n=1 Tax=Volvox carteri f. nagariensis TaxID=3068 RepID=D8UHT0_VOLCA|nr:uncharacterized protein VOLCADRAFT_108019 [Volvox carteri f. nagariensis]EFJ40753.1 hypothetical protein VOLCADRAFT_108019 [Volvox carteri f. nagariensis]|eukprot:XP_002958219.1 hypothetical protein VOLCADRAFT_108019 [Volvox carteri f. nagariensis]
MSQDQTEEAARASRAGTHAEASSSFKSKTRAQEQREQQIQVTPNHRLLNSHNYPVTCVVFSPNNELLATASRDVRIYDAKTGDIKVILDGHGGLVRSISFTPDGRLLCSGSDDCVALVWSLEHCFVLCVPGKITTLTPPGGPSSANLPTNDQKTTTITGNTPQNAGGKEATASQNFSPLSRIVQRVLKRHHKPVLAVATTPDSKYLITGSADKTVRVWDVCTGYIMATLRGHTGEVSTVAVTPNGRRIMSSGADKVIFVWDFVTGECKRALRGHKAPVSCLAVAPDGHFLVSGSHDRTLRVWDLINGNELATLSAHTGAYGVLSCAVSSDGSTIMSGGYDNLVKMWDATSGLALATIQGHRHMVSSVAFSQDSTHLATAGRDDESTAAGSDAASNPKHATERLRTSQKEDAQNNRHWAMLFGDNSGREDQDRGGALQRLSSLVRGN